MNEIVKKFGGTSVNNIQLLKDIIRNNNVVVVSAPGKRSMYDEKVTDLLDLIYQGLHTKKYINNYWEMIKDRFRDLVVAGKVDINLTPFFDEIERHFSPDISRDYLLSRGEYLTAVIVARMFGMKFVDAGDVIKFKNGLLDLDGSVSLIKKMVVANTVVPGFYGKDNNQIKLLARGGSDVTGAIIARALQSPQYENYGDESGVKMTLPRLYKNSRIIDKISFDNMKEFAKCGANILHPDAVAIAKDSNIPIIVKSIYAPFRHTTTVSHKSELRYAKAMGVKEKAVKFLLDPKVFARSFADVVNFLKDKGIVFQESVYKDGNLEIFAYADDNFDQDDLSAIENEFGQKFKTKINFQSTSEIILIVGSNQEKYQLTKILEHFIKVNGFDVDLINTQRGLAIVANPYNLKYFYNTIYQEFVDTFANYKPLEK